MRKFEIGTCICVADGNEALASFTGADADRNADIFVSAKLQGYADGERLEWVLKMGAFPIEETVSDLNYTRTGRVLIAYQDGNENLIVPCGENVYFDNVRAAIDAAIEYSGD